MDALKPFTLPLKGLSNGVHQFDFQVGSEFFRSFSASPVETGKVDVHLGFDKRPEMIVLDFDLDGKIDTSCDRCNAAIQLPIQKQEQLVVKFAAEARETDEVIYLPWETSELNVAQYVYEYIVLAVPMVKTYDCQSEEPLPCDQENLKYLEQLEEEKEEAPEQTAPNNPVWDALKKQFNKDN